MKAIPLVARYLLGIIFVVFSLNFWLGFIPVPRPEPDSLAAHFMEVLIQSDFLTLVKALEFACGILLLVGRYVNLALAVLGPIVVNISLYHLFILQGDYLMAILVSVLAVVALAGRRDFVNSLMAPK